MHDLDFHGRPICPHRSGGVVKPAAGVISGLALFGWAYDKTHPDGPPHPAAPPKPVVITHTVIKTVAAHPALSGTQIVGIIALICTALIACMYVYGRWIRP